MAKQIIYGDEARQKLTSGVNQLARAVVTTLGPRGRNVGIDRKWEKLWQSVKVSAVKMAAKTR